MKSKVCFKCNIEKPLDEFYKHPQMGDGHLNKCKECNKKDVHDNYDRKRNDPEYIIQERARGREKFQRLYRDQQRYNPNHGKNWDLNNPEKKRATALVGNAIRGGRLTRKPCEVCNTTLNVQAHHEDYTKPLEVKWLCIKHHNERHVKKREEMLYQTEVTI